MNAASDQAPIARTFAAANPIEFELHNLDDERVLYTVGDDEHLQSLILELRNDSPQDICLATPDSGIKPLDGNGAAIAWDEWAAGPSLYHFQLVFRPGVLSDRATFYLAHAAHRVAALDTGWDLHHAQDPGDHTDRISLLWLGKTVAAARADRIRHDPQASVVDFNEELSVAGEPMASFAPDALATDSLPKGGVRKFALTRLGAGTGGGGRGTRVHLRYAQLQYANDRGPVPQGSRTLYLNLINHQGRQNIPLHVGFAGSNTILNDGVTPNELELRITNISANDPITFGNHPATCFTVSFDIDEQPWALTRTGEADEIAIEWDGTPKVPLKAFDADGKPIAERMFKDSNWLPAVAEQGTRPTWSFSYVGADIRSLAPGQSVSLKLSNIRSSAPSGYTNLYLRYDHIPGYWDGRFTCLIEKAPLLYRQSEVGHGDVRIGTDVGVPTKDGTPSQPTPKLTVDVSVDNKSAERKKPAAVFEGGNVGLGTYPDATFQLHVKPKANMSAAKFEGRVLIQQGNLGNGAALNVDGGSVGIGAPNPGSKLAVVGGVSIGERYQTTAAPENGLLVQGQVDADGDLNLRGTSKILFDQQTGGETARIFWGEESPMQRFKAGRKGLWITVGSRASAGDVDEGGIFLDEDGLVVFNSGDRNLLRLYNEDQQTDHLIVDNLGNVTVKENVTVKGFVSNKNIRINKEVGATTGGKVFFDEVFELKSQSDVLLLVSIEELYTNAWFDGHIYLDWQPEPARGSKKERLATIFQRSFFRDGGDNQWLGGSPSKHFLKKDVGPGKFRVMCTADANVNRFVKGNLSIIQL